MYKFKTLAKIASQCYLKQSLRKCATELSAETKVSAREKAFIAAKEKYANHANILYSSYLECQEEHFSDRKRKWIERKLGAQEAKSKTFIEVPPALQVDKPTYGEHELVESLKFPKRWMEDYEFYEGGIDEQGTVNSTHGTSDPTVPPSTVPCSGCGAHLHCASSSLPGYIPMEIFKNRTHKELQTIVCQRCHFLQHYNIALDVEVTPETYIETISRIKKEYALAIVIVDLLDFPCSIWPGMSQLLAKRPVFVVGNKVDLLPRDSNNYLDNVKRSLLQQMINSGFDASNIKNLSLISAKTGYGIEELVTQLQKIWLHKGDVYLLGCTNVGKSSLFNTLLNSDYCRPEATDLVRKATTCPWPGTTLQMLKFPILRPSEIRVYQRFRRLFSERGQKAAEDKLRRDQARKTGSIQAAQLIGNVGRTFDKREEVADAFAMASGTQPIVALNERSLEYRQARWCYDTPGVVHPDQLTNLLTTDELLQLAPSQMMSPRAFRLKPGTSVFLAGLGRLDFVDYSSKEPDAIDWIKIFVFCSMQLPVVISPTNHASDLYQKYLGTQILGVPCGSADRLSRWPGLECMSEDIVVEDMDGERLSCDIVLSSAGWVGISIPNDSQCAFRAWTPYARGIYMRTPALTPYANRLVGKRVKNSLAYNMAKPFVFRK